MEQFFLILDMTNGVYYNPKAVEMGMSDSQWVADFNHAFFYRDREAAEHLLMQSESESVLRIVDVWVKPPSR